MRILTEPKNALVKQYQRMFELDGVGLEFELASLEAIAQLAVERKTGARGLRAIPVSYTHLDVYKRQAERCADVVLSEFNVEWLRLKLSKPGAVRGAVAVGVIIERSRR